MATNILSQGRHYILVAITIYFHEVTTTYLQLSKYLSIGSPLHTCSYQNICSWGHHYILKLTKYFSVGSPLHTCTYQHICPQDHHYILIAIKISFHGLIITYLQLSKYHFMGLPLHTCSYQNIHAYVCQSVYLFIGSSLHTCSGEATDKNQVLK